MCLPLSSTANCRARIKVRCKTTIPLPLVVWDTCKSARRLLSEINWQGRDAERLMREYAWVWGRFGWCYMAISDAGVFLYIANIQKNILKIY